MFVKQKQRWLFFVLSLLGCLSIGIALGIHLKIAAIPQEFRGTIVRSGSYKFINPILLCEIVGEKAEIEELIPIKTRLNVLVKDTVQRGDADSVALYLRALNSGRWIGINEHETFSPASMLKVVNMIAYLKLAEEDPLLLGQSLVYDGSFDEDTKQQIKNSAPLVPGKTYTIAELINNMIRTSGNNARALLKRHLGALQGPYYLNEIYDDLLLPDPRPDAFDYMSPKEYSVIFRVLYNGTYLSATSSERALGILQKTEFRDGLVAGVPSQIAVAHKFGEREISLPDKPPLNEFHDCGIVYYPGHPYFLCVMTKGRDSDRLQKVIQDISRSVYTEMDRFYTSEEQQ